MMAWAGSWLAVALLGLAEPERLERYDFTEKHMGVPVKIVLYAPDEAAANAAAQAAYARFAQLDRVLSDYDPESELMRLCRQAGTPEPTPVSGDLWKVLRRSQELARASDGAFDVTVGPLVRLWRRSRREKELPSPKLLAEALAATGFESLVLHEDARAVALLKPGMRLDLGGIGMGYAVDEAMQVLEHHGIRRALIDASGDILASAPPPGEQGWKIGIGGIRPDSPPARYVLLDHQAISTAGDAFQYVEIGGRRYSHIVDPQTGLGMQESLTVAIVASDCLTADGLDTAVAVLGPERGLQLIDATPGAAGLILRLEGTPPRERTYESKRIRDLRQTQ